MKTFIITGQRFSGQIKITYGANKVLTSIENSTDMTEHALYYFFNKVPVTTEHMQILSGEPLLNVLEEIREVTFTDFYIKYNNKVGKVEAERKWNRMPKSEQIKAYLDIDRYKASLKPGIAQMYPATYLNAQRWND